MIRGLSGFGRLRFAAAAKNLSYQKIRRRWGHSLSSLLSTFSPRARRGILHSDETCIARPCFVCIVPVRGPGGFGGAGFGLAAGGACGGGARGVGGESGGRGAGVDARFGQPGVAHGV